MKKVLIGVLVASALTSFIGCGNEKTKPETAEKEDTKVEEVKKEEAEVEETKTEVKFDVKETINITEYDVVDSKNVDVNLDKIDDEIVLLKHKTKGETDLLSKVLVINDGKTKEQLTYYDAGFMRVGIVDTYDFSSDGIPEIILETNTGGNSGGSANVIGYNGKEFVDIEFAGEGNIVTKKSDGFKVTLVEDSKNTYIENVFSGEVKQGLLELGSYLHDGGFMRNWGTWQKNVSGAVLEDIDGDGIKEILIESYMTGASNADSIIDMQRVYKYTENKFEFLGLLKKGGERTFKVSEEKKPVETNSSGANNAEEAIQVLYDMKEAKGDEIIEYELIDELVYEGETYYRCYRHLSYVGYEDDVTSGDCALLVKKGTREVYYLYAPLPASEMKPFVPQ